MDVFDKYYRTTAEVQCTCTCTCISTYHGGRSMLLDLVVLEMLNKCFITTSFLQTRIGGTCRDIDDPRSEVVYEYM